MIKVLMSLFILFFLGGCTQTTGTDGGGASPLTAVAPFVLIFVVFYFLILRPQQKQSRERREMLKNLKRADMIVTSGGMYGKILNINGDVITLEIAKGISVKVSRSGITGMSSPNIEEGKNKEEK